MPYLNPHRTIILSAPPTALLTDAKILRFINPTNGKPIEMLNIPNDAVATLPLTFTDQVGKPITAPTTGATITCDNSSVLGVALSTDGTEAILTPTGTLGTANITYTCGNVTFTDEITVTLPTITAGSFNDSALTLAPLAATNEDLASNGV